MDLEEAQKVIEQENAKKDECSKELMAVLEKHGYSLQTTTNVSLVKKESPAPENAS